VIGPVIDDWLLLRPSSYERFFTPDDMAAIEAAACASWIATDYDA